MEGQSIASPQYGDIVYYETPGAAEPRVSATVVGISEMSPMIISLEYLNKNDEIVRMHDVEYGEDRGHWNWPTLEEQEALKEEAKAEE